jgi:hypothetical protein
MVDHVFNDCFFHYRLVCKAWRIRVGSKWKIFYIPLSICEKHNGRVRDYGSVVSLSKTEHSCILKKPTSKESWLPLVERIEALAIVVVQGFQSTGKKGCAWYVRIKLNHSSNHPSNHPSKPKSWRSSESILRRLPSEFCDKYLECIFRDKELRTSSLITKWQPTDNNSPIIASLNEWDKNEVLSNATTDGKYYEPL